MHLHITIPAADISVQEILIARLEDLGYDGFQQECSHLDAYVQEEKFNAAGLEELLDWAEAAPIVENRAWVPMTPAEAEAIVRASLSTPTTGEKR